MVQAIPAAKVTLATLKEKFGLRLIRDAQFFPEWMSGADQITDTERATLDRVQTNFLTLLEQPPILENSVKMVVLSPLLDLAGFYQHPYRIETETSIEVEMEDEGTVFRGRIDVLVLNVRLWILVIEAKSANFDIQVAIPQALTYMLGNPEVELPSFGLVTNGHTFIFLKLVRQPALQYGNSRLFSLINPGNELYDILGILKQIGTAIAESN
ncbi:type I restriction endonuclease [Leptolyngbyaceae cyanobacterium UHCC 1019]